MTGYIGIKRVEAKPMNLGDYIAYKGGQSQKTRTRLRRATS